MSVNNSIPDRVLLCFGYSNDPYSITEPSWTSHDLIMNMAPAYGAWGTDPGLKLLLTEGEAQSDLNA